MSELVDVDLYSLYRVKDIWGGFYGLDCLWLGRHPSYKSKEEEEEKENLLIWMNGPGVSLYLLHEATGHP